MIFELIPWMYVDTKMQIVRNSCINKLNLFYRMHTLDCNLYLKPSMSEKEKSHSLRRAVELGWDAIIWNTYIAGKLPSKPPVYNPPSATFSRVIERDCLLSRSVISSSSSHTATTSDSLRITQYNRLTVPFDEVVDAQSVTGSTEFARSYDIIAACPMNAKVFSYLCKSADIDIIAIDFSHRVPFPLNKKLVQNINASTYIMEFNIVHVCMYADGRGGE